MPKRTAGDDPPQFLSPIEVGRLLSVSRAMVWKLIGEGELDTIRIGERAVRIPRDSFDAYVRRQAEREHDRRG